MEYGAQGQAITITLAGLANNSLRQSTAIDNSTDLFHDDLVEIAIKTGSAGVAATGYVDVYAYGTSNNGANYSGGATGSDGAYTGPKIHRIGRIAAGANATTYTDVFSVAQAFGGVLPQKWGIIVENQTGAALDGTEGSHLKIYQGVTY